MARTIGQKYNMDVNPADVVADLPVGIRQKVEILKALHKGADILILDEPTAVLTPQETKGLFAELKGLRDNGHTIVFISCLLYTSLSSMKSVKEGLIIPARCV